MKKIVKSYRLNEFTLAYIKDFAEFMHWNQTEAVEHMIAQFHLNFYGFDYHDEIIKQTARAELEQRQRV